MAGFKNQIGQEIAERLETLHSKQQRQGLTPQEQEEKTLLLGQHDRQLLLRAKAAALLTERGHGSDGAGFRRDVSHHWGPSPAP